MQKITEAAVRCLEVSRASIWLLSPGGESLRCHAAYDQLSKANVERLELPAAHFSLYWKFLKQRLTIAAENVETDPAFQEILKDYMRPNGIRATLDAGIRINGALTGVICLEERRSRKWTFDAKQLAAFLAEVSVHAIHEAELRQIDILSRSFADLGRKLNACTTPRMAARLIGQTAQKLWGWDSMFLLLEDPASSRLVPVLAMDTISGRRVQVPFAADDLALTRVRRFLQEEKFLYNGHSAALQLTPFGDVQRPSQSRMFITIRDGDRPLALLSIQSYSPDAYCEKALDGLAALGEYCTGAVARLQAQALRRESEERFRKLAEGTTEGILIHSATRVYEANGRLGQIFGYSDSEIRNLSLPDLIPAARNSKRNGASQPTRSERIEETGVRKNGTVFPLEMVTRRCRYLGKSAMVTVMRDISERKRVEEELRNHSRKILEVQEAERHRVSRDLHDSVNQLLTAAQFRLESVTHSLVASPERAQTNLNATRELLSKAMEEIRTISWNLRPNDLDAVGLPGAIRTLCQDSEDRTGIAIAFHYPKQAGEIDKASAVALFRIIQEGLANACRHSKARHITLTIRWTRDTIVMDLTDDGAGFSPATSRPAGRKNGLGLLNMRERASAAGGRLTIDSAPGKGAKIHLELPANLQSRSGKDDSNGQKPAISNQKRTGAPEDSVEFLTGIRLAQIPAETPRRNQHD